MYSCFFYAYDIEFSRLCRENFFCGVGESLGLGEHKVIVYLWYVYSIFILYL